MSLWRPDEDFLKFLLYELENSEVDIPALDVGEAYGLRELIEEMQNGTELGKLLYNQYYNNPTMQKLYNEYKSKSE